MTSHKSTLSEDVQTQLRRTFVGKAAEWWVRDISSSYSWLHGAQLLLVLDSGSDKSAVVYRDEKVDLITNSPNQLKKTAEILESHFKKLPDGDQLLDFLGTIKDLAIDPRAYIGSEKFFKSKESVLEGWLLGRTKDPAQFRIYCADPIVSIDRKENTWATSYFVFNARGGVDEIAASGKVRPLTLEVLTTRAAESDGAFSFPEEM